MRVRFGNLHFCDTMKPHTPEQTATSARWTDYRCSVCCRSFRVLSGTNPLWPEDCEGASPTPPLPPRLWAGTPRQRDPSRPNVAIITTAIAHGGAEEWMRLLIQSTPGINWIGIGQPRHALTTPESIAAFERLLPVIPVPERWDALSAADVLITWGTAAAREPPPPGRPVVFVSSLVDVAMENVVVRAIDWSSDRSTSSCQRRLV